MKTQMRFQKIYMLVSLIIAALVIVLALVFCSGTLNQMAQPSIYDVESKLEYIEGAQALFESSQGFSDLCLILGIICVLAICLNYIMGTQNRRKYYITNYVAIGVAVAVQLAVAIIIIALVANCQSILNGINLEEAKETYEIILPGAWKESTWTFGAAYAVAALLLVNAAGFVLNLVWKIKLMKGEKALLQGEPIKEAA